MPKRLVWLVTLFVLVCSTLFVINQTAQVVSLAHTISPLLAQIVLSGLLILYAIVIIAPIVLFIRMPKPISPPADEQSQEYDAYLRRLAARLTSNPHLAGAGALRDRASIESALKVLDEKAAGVIKQTASALFLTTAVSQNGRLDALMVLAEQTRLIWKIAHIYNQRPTARDFGRLYANVGATLFAASALEDLDIREQIEPVVNAAVGGAMASLVPGIAFVASIVVNSVLDGTANAYLTLRVGLICQSYSRSMTTVDRKQARRHASLAAASMLGSIVSSSAGSVTRAILAAARKAGESKLESAATGIRRAGDKLNPFRVSTGKQTPL
jgi:hypothetical protein